MAQTNRHTDGHGDSMTDPAQRAESVKIRSWNFASRYFVEKCAGHTFGFYKMSL